MDQELGFNHEYIPGEAGGRTLLLLHGTGGNEHDLLELGRQLDPLASLLSPRGKVLERGMPRFFRRLAEGVFDIEDLKFRTAELAEFVERAAASYALDRGKLVAVGFSNGANIAASLLLLRPGLLAGAILLRAMVPLVPEQQPDLSGVGVLIAAGQLDQMIPQQQTRQLAELLEQAGASVTLRWYPGGHGLTQQDVDDARAWLAT